MGAILETKGICKYFGGLKAVNNVDLEVLQGKIHGIIGPNGAGKTTLFNVLTGTFPPTGGDVFFKGQKITGMAPERIARLGMARTFQNIKLFRQMTVLDNVKIGFHIRTATGLLDAVARTRTYKKDEEFSNSRGLEILHRIGLGAHAHEMAASLPYGDQRRLEIARAMAAQPDLLLLDEPAAGMNPAETEKMVDFIKDLSAEGFTIIVIEHDMRLIMNVCHNITVLNHGEKIAEGPPESIQTNTMVIEAYLGRRRSRAYGPDAGKGGAASAQG
ncbi:MAG: ABC transporter ATP-binding protein [Firmicutes bacterium]|jgi:branched-chain amino acid transport system ATP-binding protein|nr:ABC transporter ATP-binding protein [Bacillota bacterium]